MGLLLGIAGVFFIDYLDNTLRTAEDIERYLGLSVLSVVPRYADGARENRAVREAYQTLRTSLIFSSANRERKIVLVCSAAPQEGKSSTVANLARALAGAGDRVIVIDCDLRKPTQHLHLKLGPGDGLTNYLVAKAGQADWRSCVRIVGPENLHALPCGPIPPNPPELLGSDRFAQLLVGMRSEYDWILLDSPPAISISDATYLASLSDLVVLVVRYNHTDRARVRRGVAQFRAVGANVAGVVLNNVDVGRHGDKGYDYAGYYFSSDEEKIEKQTASARSAPGSRAT